MSVNWTKEQREAIETTGKNLLVSASAGSGKTTVMINRVIELMIKEHIPITNFLVVTFTNASAEDMKKRLIDSLLLLPADEFVLNQIENISTSDISNLHSFCSRLITTYFYEIGIDPSYHIVDETESKFLKEKAISRLFEIKENEYNEDFFMLFDMFQKKRKTSELKEIIFKFNNFLNSNVDSKTWFDEKLKLSYDENLETNDCAKLIKNYVCNSILELQEEIGEFIKFCQSADFNKYANYFIDLYEKIGSISYKKSFISNAKNLFSIEFDRLPSEKIDSEYEFVIYEADKLNKLVKKQIDNFKSNFVSGDENVLKNGIKSAKQVLEKLFVLVQEFNGIYSKLKLEVCGLDFNDLEFYALKILSNKDILSSVKEKYKYVFVDEYQDINSVQEKIISLISSENNRFMVGDIKQSIYRFRLCDPEIFLSKYSEYSTFTEMNKVIPLNCNFRSDKKILKFVDDVFSGVMTAKFGGIDYEKDSKFVAGENNLDNENSMNLLYIDTELPRPEKQELKGIYSVKNHIQEEDEELKKAIAEASLVARKIAELVDLNSPNHLKYEDIAILVSSRNDAVAKFIETLQSFNIPVSSDEKYDLMKKSYIQEIVNFIKYACNKNDDILLFKVLKSKLFDFSDSELVSIRKLDNKLKFYECFELYEKIEDEKLRNKILKFKSIYEKYNKLVGVLKIKEIANLVVDEFCLNEINLTNIDGEKINKEIEKFIEFLPDVGVFEFVTSYENFAIEIENECGGDAVKLMTIHKSKGIEFKVVFLINTCNEINLKSTYGSILFNKDFGVGVDYFDLSSRIKIPSLPISAIRMLEKRKIVEEQQRVLYVALTRAVEKLFVICSKSEKDLNKEFPNRPNSFINWFEKFISNELEGNHLDYLNFEKYDIQDLLVNVKKEDKQILFKEEKVNCPTPFEYGHFGSVDLPLKNSISKILNSKNDEENFYEENVFSEENISSSSERGTVYHKVLQNIDLKSLNNLEEQFEKIKNNFSEKELKIIDFEKVKKTLEMPFFKQICDDDIILKEREFLSEMSAKIVNSQASEDDTFILQGVIDLIVIHENEVVILDYKTGKISEEKLNNYKFQIECYSSVCERWLDKKISKKIICFIDEQKIIEF